MTSRVSRPVAAREVISASERLMDGLLTEERVCVERIHKGMTTLAVDLTNRVRARARTQGRVSLLQSVEDLLPTRALMEPVLMPPIGDLIAITRKRTLEVVARQIKACAATAGDQWVHLIPAAVRQAQGEAADLERSWYDRANRGLSEAGAIVRTEMQSQYRLWAKREEPLDALLRRWLHTDNPGLVGADARGAIWPVQSRMVFEARTAYVGLSNGVVLAGMRGWNGA